MSKAYSSSESSSSSSELLEDIEPVFLSFAQDRGKVYSCPEEENLAKERLRKTYKRVIHRNLQFEAGNITYKTGLNQFSDLDHDEAIATLCRAEKPPTLRSLPQKNDKPAPESYLPGPESIDWTPFLQPIVDQGVRILLSTFFYTFYN